MPDYSQPSYRRCPVRYSSSTCWSRQGAPADGWHSHPQCELSDSHDGDHRDGNHLWSHHPLARNVSSMGATGMPDYSQPSPPRIVQQGNLRCNNRFHADEAITTCQPAPGYAIVEEARCVFDRNHTEQWHRAVTGHCWRTRRITVAMNERCDAICPDWGGWVVRLCVHPYGHAGSHMAGDCHHWIPSATPPAT